MFVTYYFATFIPSRYQAGIKALDLQSWIFVDEYVDPSLHRPDHDFSVISSSHHQRSNRVPYQDSDIKVDIHESGSPSNNDKRRHPLDRDIKEKFQQQENDDGAEIFGDF